MILYYFFNVLYVFFYIYEKRLFLCDMMIVILIFLIYGGREF